ncbi:MAG TPA: LysM peptidoglycan-binding domain-containing protein [Chloroflexia bacterium]|nr:LysM peptidoglycan-binding domain-containing protein [Chloroflexia bacterium]
MIKNALQNSCAKGCMVYLVALALLVAFTSMGLGGLSTRLGGSSQPQASVLTDSRQPAGVAPQSAPAASGDVAQPTAAPPTNGPSIVLALPTIQIVTDISVSVPAPVNAPAPTSAPASAPAPAQPQAQPQGGEITGDASPPFYIVQSGDTLWSIAVEYGVGTDGLRGINNLADDIIKPGQLLYLPQLGQPQQPAPTGAPAQPPSAQDQGNPAPQMPQTGINTRP